MSYYKELGKKLKEHHKSIEKKVEILKSEEPDKIPHEELDTIYEIAEAILKILNSISDIDKELENKVDKIEGKGLSTNDYTTIEKDKLKNIADEAEVNQNAFSNVKVDQIIIAANDKTDTLFLEGNNITITPDALDDKVVFDITKENVISALGYTPSTGASSTNRRFSLVGQSSSTTTNPWYKFASLEIPTSRQDYDITFMVRRTFGNNYIDDMGILRAHVRADASTECEIALLEWLAISSSINPSDFVLGYMNDTTTPSVKVDLWVKCSLAYSMWNFDVLSEGSRLSNTDYWTLYTTTTAGSESEITSGYTQVESVVLDLGQNANSASKLYINQKNNTYLTSYSVPYAYNDNTVGNKELLMNNSFNYKTLTGTESMAGRSALFLGNSIPEGSDGNMTGSIFVYGAGSHYTQLASQLQTADRTIIFPDVSGNVALMANVPLTRSAGTSAAHRIVGVHGFISDLGKQAMLYLPLIFDRSVTYSSVITITKLLCDIRTVEGTLLGGSFDSDLTSYVTETYIYLHQGLIRIALTKNDGWGVTNNTPLCGDCSMDYTIN